MRLRRYKTTPICASIDGIIYVGSLKVTPGRNGEVAKGITFDDVMTYCYPEQYAPGEATPPDEKAGADQSQPPKKQGRQPQVSRGGGTVKRRGRLNSQFKGWYEIDGIKYESSRLAEERTGINFRTIVSRCKSKKEKFKHYRFIPKRKS